MTYHRSETEYRLLRAEAERRVRAGEVRAAVARDIGVPYTTVSRWAATGGWLRKDIDVETREEVTALVSARLAARLAEARDRRAAAVRLTPLGLRPETPPPANDAVPEAVMEYKSATGRPGVEPAGAQDAFDPFAPPPGTVYRNADAPPDSLTPEEAARSHDVQVMREDWRDPWLAAGVAATEAALRYERGELEMAIKLSRFAKDMYALQQLSDACHADLARKEEAEAERAWHERQTAGRNASRLRAAAATAAAE